MYNYSNQCKIYYMILFLYEFSCMLENKYIKKNDIILYRFYHPKYDKIHDLTILYCLFNIQIYIYFNKNFNKYKIYKDNILISDTVIYNSRENISIKPVSNIVFLDNYNVVNDLVMYNCGKINHKNVFINHEYDFKASRLDKKIE